MIRHYLFNGEIFTRNWGTRLCLALFLLVNSTLLLQAQQMHKKPGPVVVCPGHFEDMQTYHAVPKRSANFQKSLQANATSEITITYGPGAQGNADVQTAFRFALDIWASEIVSSVPIRVFADFANLGPGTLASAGPTTVVTNFPNAPVPDVYYNSALANTLAGEILDPNSQFDLNVRIGNGINWYFGTDGNPGPGQIDFVTVALHEAGHGLGFVSLDEFLAGGIGTFQGFGLPFTGIYNTYIVNGDGVRLTDLQSPSIELGNELISNDLFMDGPETQAAFNGESPQIFAPNPYRDGSSISHWNEASFPAGDPNSLMTPNIGQQEVNFDLGDITRGLFRDLGWVFSVDNARPIAVSPGVISEVLSVDTSITRTISVENIVDSVLIVMAEASPGGSFISFPNSATLTLGALETGSLDVEINTAGLAKGLYEESIDFIVVDGEDTVTVAVVIQVLDGSEAPSIEVDPLSFVETANQFSVITRDLTISNTGDADLTYSIDILPAEVVSNFSARVEQTRAAIAGTGFTSQSVSTGNRGTSFSSALKHSNGDFQKLVTSLYATDFEDFNLGDLSGQMGWVSQDVDNYVISGDNASDGSRHIRAVSDGLGSTRDFTTLALSPSVTPGDEPFMVASADIAITGTGVTWEFVPQSNTSETIVTIVRFNPDGSIVVGDASSGTFVQLNETIPTGYFNIKLILDRATSNFNLFIDGELVYSGLAFASEIEQLVFASPMNNTGSTLDIDNVEIIDGVPDAFWLTVNPSAGTVSPGDSAVLDVNFDARSLIPDTYFATITINSNDLNNSTVVIPVNFTVTVPPTITVAPDSLFAAVNVETDDPATDTETFTITNTGASELTFTTGTGGTDFTAFGNTPESGNPSITIASLDMRDYGFGNTSGGAFQNAGITGPSLALTAQTSPTAAATNFTDSIFYDSGSGIATDFIGLNSLVTAVSSAVRFDVDTDFTLTAIRNLYRTQDLDDATIILEVYRGGDTPADGELLTAQAFSETSADGIFRLEVLEEAQSFSAGETFWVVHKYPVGIPFAQGIDEDGTVRPGANLFSNDGGVTWDNPNDNFIILCRALSDGGDSYITLEPSTGTVAPGESVEVTATFDGSELANGVYETDILVSSNDPVNPVATVATVFEVSGQVAEVAISDEFLLFDNVFVGNEKEKTVTIFNPGFATLNVTSITSDEDDFTVSPESATIGAGDSLVLTVTFAPSSTGNINGIITIETDAGENGTLEIVVNGVGVDPPIAVFDPKEVSATVAAGETTEVTVTLKNEGNSPLIYSFPRFAAQAALSAPDVVLNNTEFIEFAQPAGLTEETFVDNRKGHLVKSSVGTDLFYGYTWIDNDEDGGPVYNYSDISATGTDVTPDVGISGAIETALPFPFFFYGETYSDVFVYADGFVAFQQATGNAFINSQIPEEDGVNNIIAAFWDNFNPQDGGNIYYEAFADRFVVQWTDMQVSVTGTPDATATFQVVLYPDGTIDVFYEDVETYSQTDEGTVGIENVDATDGAQVAFNTDYIKDGLALRFIVPERPLTNFISDVSRLSGVIPAGGSRELTVTLDATDLTDGVYFDDLTVSSNSPDASHSTVEFELTVIGTPELSVTPDTITFDPIFVGLESEATFVIENLGTKALDLSSVSTSTDNFSVEIDDAAATLQPGGSVTATVVFSPTEAGVLMDEITISSSTDGVDDVTVTLIGTGIAPPVIDVTPESLTVVLDQGESTDETVTICNTGDATLTYIVTPFTLSDPMTDELQSSTYPQLDFPAILTKEEGDTRKGPGFVNASGGPGTFGYTWVDNNSGGEAYDFIDISTTGTSASVGADGSELVTLPFSFPFFGEEQSEVFVAANGFLSFEPITALFGAFSNQQIPSPGNPNNLIAGMWNDLEPQDGGGVFFDGNADRFIVQYENVPSFGFPDNTAPVTFQVILFPDGSIKMQYENVDAPARLSSTVGLEGPMGQSGLQVIFNAPYLTDELAITFTPPTTGSLEPGECDDVTVTISAEDLAAGNYQGEIVILSNDPQAAETVIPVDLTVNGVPALAQFLLIDADADTVVGPLQEGDIVDIGQFPSRGFNIVAVPAGTDVGSVKFVLNGMMRRVESKIPYAVGGDRGPGRFNSFEFPLGTNTISATPYSRDRARGEVGETLAITFEVVDNSAVLRIEDFLLVDADADTIIGSLVEGDVVDISQFPSGGFNIVAIPAGDNVRSIVFELNGNTRRAESKVPYAVGGDRGPGRFRSLVFPLGMNTLVATPYAGEKGRGEAGMPLAITFEVISGNSANSEVLAKSEPNTDVRKLVAANTEVTTFPNPVRDIVNFTLGADLIGSTEITLMSLMGQVIYRPLDIDISANGTGSINMSNLTPGTYIMILTDGKGNITARRKLIKQ
ncbi:Ig-like domain-containing protein [Neolewinella antarctica]|uniref:Choice-of-anchor D domain-containing protein n=1 Tax=Neolewinella antarctica TaxID=442734 RepID=A0ABX0X830_9BACT|nr:choice-of-anchor D domain-containing protein [Neolewinella antarctica]NJC25361.1 hypothetical protein [Neolewinella antarctica]